MQQYSDDLLKQFLDWVDAEVLRRCHGVATVSVVVGKPSDNSAARVDIDVNGVSARITFWESGDYVAEVIDFESADTLYFEPGEVADGREMSRVFEPFFAALFANARR